MRLALNYGQSRHIQTASSNIRMVGTKQSDEQQQFGKPHSQPMIGKQRRHKKDTTDIVLFKEKEQISDIDPPLSCFKLISYLPPKFFVSLEDLNRIDFPMLSYSTSQLINISKMIIQATPERKHIGKAFNLHKLIEIISQNYNVTAYHNFTHAFSLMLLLFQSYNRSSDLRKVMNQKQWFYVFIAALAHDLNHPGSTNTFEVKKRSQLAIEAENVSVLEKMHLNVFWSILKKNSQVNFLQGYTSYESAGIKQLITKMILATDVSFHFKSLQSLKKIENTSDIKNGNSTVLMANIFHGCDIGNPCLDFKSYMNWGALITYQFNQIAKRQQALGWEVTGFLKYSGLKKYYNDQLGFCNGLVLPLWKQMSRLLPDLSQMRQNIQQNIKEMQKRKQASQNQE